MKILQALKKIKHLTRKIEKNRERLLRWSSYYSDEDPIYDQEDILKLIQSTDDLVEKRNELRHALHKTNLGTVVEFRGKKMSLDELIGLRTTSYPERRTTLEFLRRKEKKTWQEKDVNVIMQYDPSLRDKALDAIDHAIDELDEILDNTNVTTELIA